MDAIPLSSVENTFCPTLNLMSNTPRTDKEQFNEEGEDAFLVVCATFARELDRELAQEKAGTASLYAEKNALEELSAAQGERVLELERELAEQVLCNGKGAEREADLLGKVERLEREIACLREAAMGCLPLAHEEASAITCVKVKASSLGALLRLCNSEPSA